MADVDNTNNITGFKNARVDELCEAYDKMFDVEERVRALREIDGILANAYHYALQWNAPYARLVYWNKFGTPSGYLSRTGDFFGAGSGPGLPQMWWIDPAKDANLQQALRDQSLKLEVGPTEDRYWIEFGNNEQ